MVLFIYTDRGKSCGTTHGVTVVSEAAVEDLVLEMFCDMVAHTDSTEGKIAARKPFGHADQIGHNLPVVHGKPFAGAAKSRHNFVGNHQNPVPGADLAHALQITIRRHENAIRAGHRLQNESSDVLRSLELDDFFHIRQGLLDGIPSSFNPVIWIENANNARDAGFVRPTPWVACDRHAPR